MNENELKPCPFCGGKAALKKVRGSYKTNPTTINDEWKVSCEKECCACGTFQDMIYHADNGEIIVKCNGAKEAVEAWNKRV